jgi:simple sugar transport system ATP-binding protein
MARELSRPLRLFIASQPTRGVDVGSIEFLHKRIVAERDSGTPVMIISTELDEVMELADRIAVLYKGKLVGIVPAGTGRDVLGLMMAGISPEDASRTDAPGAEKSPADNGPTESVTPEATKSSTAEGGDHD